MTIRKLAVLALFLCHPSLFAAQEPNPRGQSKPPGPALAPEQAMAKMELPPDFSVQLVASEPQIVNPTSMTFDEKGRIWITESVEYPRAAAGKGNDRIKILEDINHNGKFEKITVFKDGLNIPCGIVIGNGGVYCTNSPDILFLQDTRGTGVCDKEEVILTGFGRDDRHELPNSLTWGPDGWLYGMNGVFNRTRVNFDGKLYDFTCAIWRYHPKHKKFELFAEGTSNPWGLDYNQQGDWFVSCCVIDHLFHMTQSGYYTRQGGPYPRFIAQHPIRSITTQKHQAAAYAGLNIYQGDAYPEDYRGTFLMGNLHGSCVNHDSVVRNGSTYKQSNLPDFLKANDVWFMPVSQKTGPDGCVYIMDWYDRYHCYQDANRDPNGVDRTNGRIYRIAYKNTPLAKPFDLGALSNDELLKLFAHPNVWQRREAQRLLNERFDPRMIPALEEMALATDDKTQAYMHALWLLCSQDKLDEQFHLKLLSHADPVRRNWGARAVGAMQTVPTTVYEKLKALAADPSPDVRVQVAVAAGRLKEPAPLPVFYALLSNAENAKDPLIPNIVYNNMIPLAGEHGAEILSFFEENAAAQTAFGENVGKWIRDVANALGAGKTPAQLAADVKKAIGNDTKLSVALRQAIDAFAASNLKIDSRAKEFDPETRAAVAKAAAGEGPAHVPATLAALWWNDAGAVAAAERIAVDAKVDAAMRAQIVSALADQKVPTIDAYTTIVTDKAAPDALRKAAVEALGNLDDPKAASVIVSNLKAFSPELQALSINALVRSKAAATALLNAVDAKEVAASSVNSNHVRQLLSLDDASIAKRVTASWGTVRTERDPERVEVIKKMREVLNKGDGDPLAGWKVFEAKCQQCHSIYGKGNDVGPELTGVGRENIDAILSNVLDPSLIIGKGYEVHVVKTKSGKIFTGLLAEDSEKQVVLKREGNVRDTIPRDEIVKVTMQPVSLMPEGLEKNMTEQEFRDLVSFLLTKSPPVAKKK